MVAAHYAHGTLLLTEAAGTEGRSSALFMAGRNSTLPLASGLVGGAGAGGLREMLSQLDNCIPGRLVYGYGRLAQVLRLLL